MDADAFAGWMTRLQGMKILGPAGSTAPDTEKGPAASVTLKSAPTGMQGIKVTGAHSSGLPLWTKGTGKTFTINASASGNAIGKSVKIGICTYANNFGADSGRSGYSPAAKKTVTVR